MKKIDMESRKIQSGYLLIEMLVAILIFFISATAFIPLLMYITNGTQFNKVRLVATRLASSQIEYIRSLPYSGVGNITGNPSGNITHTTLTILNGITYTITTDIMWVNDPSDDVGGVDPIPYDYKRVSVSVTAPGFTRAVTTVADIRTVVAMEGEEEAFPGGNIRANAYRAWNMTGGEKIPVSGIQIDLGPTAHQTLWTDEAGVALFAILAEGPYVISVDASSKGFMVNPMQFEQNCVVSLGVTTPINFEVEKPCYLTINLKNKDTRQMVTTSGSIVLGSSLTGQITKNVTSGVVEPFGEIWPVGVGYPGAYNLLIMMEGYLPYDLSTQTPAPWDGTFSAPGETKTLDIKLTPTNASVTVTSSGSNQPVPGATVEIYRHTYTYENRWVDNCSITPIATAQTAVNGNTSFSLENNSPFDPPAVPVNEDQYTRYCVKVTAPGYQTFNTQHNAFGIKDGIQTISPFPAILQPNFCSIKVITRRNSGKLRDQISIKVTGNGYEKVLRTGSGGNPGEAIFSGLVPGAYTVYRWDGGGWIDAKSVTAVSGEYLVAYKY